MEDRRVHHAEQASKAYDASVPATAPPPAAASASRSNSSLFGVASLPSTSSVLSNPPSPRSHMSSPPAAPDLQLKASQASISAPAVVLDEAVLLAAHEALVAADSSAVVEPPTASAAPDAAGQAPKSGVKSIWRYWQSKKSRGDGASHAENAVDEPPGRRDEGRSQPKLAASKSSGTLAELGRSRSGALEDVDAADVPQAAAGKDDASFLSHRPKDKGGSRWWWSRERKDKDRDGAGARSHRGSRDGASEFSAPDHGGRGTDLREAGYLSDSTALQRKSLAARRSARGNRSSSADAYNDLDSESDSGAPDHTLPTAQNAKGGKTGVVSVPAESKFSSWFWGGSASRDSNRVRHSSGGAVAAAPGVPEALSAHPIDESDIDTIEGASDTEGLPDPEPQRSSWLLGLRRTASTPLGRDGGRKAASTPGSVATQSRHGASGAASATDAAIGAVPEGASVRTKSDDAATGDGGSSTREQSLTASWTGEEVDAASKSRGRGHRRHGSMSLLFKWKKDDMLLDSDADAAAAAPPALKKGAKAERQPQPETTSKASALSCFGISRTMSEDGDEMLRHIEGLQAGAIGLTNLGNTCFINSALQCLRCTPALLQVLVAPEELRSIQEQVLARLQPPPDASPLSPESSRAGASMAGTLTSAAADSPQSRVTPENTPRSPPAADASAHADASRSGETPRHAPPQPGVDSDGAAGAPPESVPPPGAPASGRLVEPGPAADLPGAESDGQPQPVAESQAHVARSSDPSQDVSPLASSRSDATVVVNVQPRGASDVNAPPLGAYEQLLDRFGALQAQRCEGEAAPDQRQAPLPGGGVSAGVSPAARSSMDSVIVTSAAAAADAVSASPAASVMGGTPTASEGASNAAAVAPGAGEGAPAGGEGGAAPPEVPPAPAPVPATKEEVVQSLLEVMARLCVATPEAVRLQPAVAAHELYGNLRRFPQGRHFCDGGQHDAQELIRMALEVLHETRNRVAVKPPYVEERDGDESPRSKADRLWEGYLARDSSPITDLFLGQLESSILCHNCKTTFHTYEPFMDISLSLTKEGKSSFFKSKALDSLDDCLRAFASEEKLDKHDAFHCTKCSSHSAATKTMRVHRFPRCLVLHIKRFKVQNKQHVKMTNSISFPAADLRPGHIASEHCPDPDFRLRYDLYAVSSHTGSLSSGHYTAACKLKCADGTQQWFHFDDAVVTRIAPERISTQDAYLLFYVRRSASECPPLVSSLEKTQSLM